MGNKKSKLLASVISLSAYISSVSAQGFSVIGGSGGTEASMVEFFNEMVFYGFQVDSVAGIMLFFVAPLFGFYMINKNIFEIGFESFEERIDRSNYARTNEDLPTGLKGAALAVAFITVQVVGFLGTFMLLLITGLAYTAWVLNFVGLFGDYTGGGSSGGGSSSSSSSQTGGTSQEILDELEDMKSENQQLRDELEQIRAEQEEDESDMENGDEGPEEAETHIEQELKQLNSVEQILNQLEEEVERVESEIKSQEQQTEQEEQEELELLETLQRQQNKLYHALSKVDAAESEMIENENEVKQMIESVSSPDQINLDAIDEDLAYNIKNLQNVEEMFKNIREMEQNEFQELQNVLQDEKDVLANIEAQGQEIQDLSILVKNVFQESELLESLFESEEDVLSMAERLAHQVEDREDYQRLENDEKVIDDLEQKFNTILNKEQQLRQRLEDLEDTQQQEEGKHEKALRELRQLEQSMKKVQELLQEIDQHLEQFLDKAQVEERSIEEAMDMFERGETGDSNPRDVNWENSEAAREYERKANDRGTIKFNEVKDEFDMSVQMAESLLEDLRGMDGDDVTGLREMVIEMKNELQAIIREVEKEEN